MSNLWQIYHLVPLCSELKAHSTFPVWMSNSLVWQQPRAQPARLEPWWSLIGPVQSCVTDRKPADWGRRYLRIVALIKASRRRFVNSRRSGSPHQRPGPAGLNYSSAALVWFTASSRCLDWSSGPEWQAPPPLHFHLPPPLSIDYPALCLTLYSSPPGFQIPCQFYPYATSPDFPHLYNFVLLTISSAPLLLPHLFPSLHPTHPFLSPRLSLFLNFLPCFHPTSPRSPSPLSLSSSSQIPPPPKTTSIYHFHPIHLPLASPLSLPLPLPLPRYILCEKWKQRAACQNISIAVRWRSSERRQCKKMCRHICWGSGKMESSLPVAFLQSLGKLPPHPPLSLALFKSPLFEILIWHGTTYKCRAVYLCKSLALPSCPSPCCPKWSDETNGNLNVFAQAFHPIG